MGKALQIMRSVSVTLQSQMCWHLRLAMPAVFHHMQAIVQWMKHRDHVDTYSSLVSNFVHYRICMVLILRIGKFLCDNYRQALSVMAGIPALQETMAKLNIPSVKCFPQWLSEELAYLKSQEQEPRRGDFRDGVLLQTGCLLPY